MKRNPGDSGENTSDPVNILSEIEKTCNCQIVSDLTLDFQVKGQDGNKFSRGGFAEKLVTGDVI